MTAAPTGHGRGRAAPRSPSSPGSRPASTGRWHSCRPAPSGGRPTSPTRRWSAVVWRPGRHRPPRVHRRRAAGADEPGRTGQGQGMPPMLRRLFLEVANGGFGPRRGILGVRGHGLTYNGDWTDLLHVYRAFSPRMPREMLWLFDWGCAIWSLVDCSRPEGQMWVWDPNGAEDPSPANSLFRQAMTLTDWLAAWLHGHADQPGWASSAWRAH